jgi:hypothetical protein
MAQQLPNIRDLTQVVSEYTTHSERFTARRIVDVHTLYLIIVGLSSDNPNPYTLKPSGNPIGNNISGRNIPLFPISTHFPRPIEISALHLKEEGRYNHQHDIRKFPC